MTPEQSKWMEDHPAHKRWFPHGAAGLIGWTEVGFLYPNGRFVETSSGDDKWVGPNLISHGETLVVVSPDAIKVGREYAIC